MRWCPCQTMQVCRLKSLQLKEAVWGLRLPSWSCPLQRRREHFVRCPVFRWDDSVFSPVFMQFGIHQPSSSTKANVRSPSMGQVISCVNSTSCSAPISPVHAVLFTFCLCIVIIQYHVKFVSVKKLYDTIYKPCLNNYTQNVFVFIVSVNMCKVRCMMPWLYDPFCHYRKQTNVPQPKTDEHIFMVEEHKLRSPANISWRT
jgi:hypothetical protein